jgi:hypothetical protein
MKCVQAKVFVLSNNLETLCNVSILSHTSPTHLRGRDVEDAGRRALLLRAPIRLLQARLCHDGVSFVAGVCGLGVGGPAVEAHIDGERDGELEVLRVVL